MLVQDSFLDMHDTNDELDDTLSLCDLPLYEDLSIESQGSTSMSSDDHDDYFEFFSHEVTHSTNSPHENIIFCWKIIQYKQPPGPGLVPPKEADAKQATGAKKRREWGLFRWRVGSKSKSNKGATTQASKKMYKMPILTSSPSGKASWLFFLTGISRFSCKMEPRDIKSRQSSRHGPTTSHDEKVESRGLWEVVRVLSCGGNQDPNAMVVGSISCNKVEGR